MYSLAELLIKQEIYMLGCSQVFEKGPFFEVKVSEGMQIKYTAETVSSETQLSLGSQRKYDKRLVIQ